MRLFCWDTPDRVKQRRDKPSVSRTAGNLHPVLAKGRDPAYITASHLGESRHVVPRESETHR